MIQNARINRLKPQCKFYYIPRSVHKKGPVSASIDVVVLQSPVPAALEATQNVLKKKGGFLVYLTLFGKVV